MSDSPESDRLSTGHEKLDGMANTSRMTSYQRREQLIEIGRSLFASKGFEAVSVEEIAATAKVSKPIVYEHFGGKEGLYAVVVDREMRALTDTLVNALSDPQAHPRQIVERTALALLTYVEENAEGFRVLTRDSPKTDPASSFNSLLGDIALRVEDILAEAFKRQHLPAKGVPYYAQMLIGMTVYTCLFCGLALAFRDFLDFAPFLLFRLFCGFVAFETQFRLGFHAAQAMPGQIHDVRGKRGTITKQYGKPSRAER